MSNASKSFTSMQATRSHRRDVNGMVGQWSTFNQMRTFLREICVPLQPADPLKSTASAALQNGLMFQPHSEDELFQMSNWTGRPKVRRRGGMAQSVGRLKQVIQLGNSSQARKIRWHGSVGSANCAKSQTIHVNNLLESNGFCAFETKCKLFLNIQKVCSIMLKIIELEKLWTHRIFRDTYSSAGSTTVPEPVFCR